MRSCYGSPVLAALAIVVLSCSDSPSEPQPGTLEISVRLSGNAVDDDGFIISVRNQTHRVKAGDTLRITGVPPGEHTVRVSDVAQHCASSIDSTSVVTSAATITSLEIEAACYGRFVFTVWSGPWQDQLHYLDERGQRRKLTAPMAGGQWQARWSPDGTRVVFERWQFPGDPDVWIADLNGNAWPLAASAGNSELHPSWSPDGQWVIYVYHDGLSTFSETDIRRIRPDGTGDHSFFRNGVSLSPAYSPDGRYIAFGCWREEHGVCYLSATGELLGRAPPVFRHPQTLRWSPDGTLIALETIDAQQSIRVLTVATGEAVVMLPELITYGEAYWTPDGTRLVLSVAEPGNVHAVHSVAPTGAAPRRLAHSQRWIGPLSPDGRKLPVGRELNGFRLMDVETLDEQLVMSGSETFGRGWFKPHGLPSSAAHTARPLAGPLPAAAAQPVRLRADERLMTSSVLVPPR